VLAALAVPGVAGAEERTSGEALAERLGGVAWQERQVAEAGGPGAVAAAERAAALRQAATLLSPEDSRHWWNLAQAALAAGDPDLALDALRTYRSDFDADDDVANIRFLDLQMIELQRADAQLDYLNAVLGVDRLSPAVRSHAAMLAHGVLLDRGDDEDAAEMLERALELNDLNPQALQARYNDLVRTGTRQQRLVALLDLLRAGPAQPSVMAAIGDELAAAGLPDLAVQWQTRAIETSTALGLQPAPATLARFAELLLINNEPLEAGEAAGVLLQIAPDDPAGLFLQLLADRRQGRAEGVDNASFRATRRGLIARLNALSDLAAGTEVPEQPDAQNLPDFAADIEQLRQRGDEQLVAAYGNTLADLAWLNVYFGEQPADPSVLAALTEMLGAQSAVLARIEGWSALNEGRADAARVKLSAVTDRDPLSTLGLLRLEHGEDIPADAGSAVLSRTEGLPAAIAADALLGTGATIEPADDATALEAALSELPDEVLGLLDPARARDMYTLRLEPLKVPHAYSEPMLVRVTLINTGEIPLTVGPGGQFALSDTVWLDASISGQGVVPGVVQQPIGGKVRLEPGEGTSRVFRVDNGQVAQLLASDPTRPVDVQISGFMNPVVAGTGIVPGPGGFRQRMRRPLARQGTPLQGVEQRREVFNQLVRGTGAEKIQALGLMTTFVQLMQSNPDPAADSSEAIAPLLSRLERARDQEADPAVRAWAGLMLATLADDAERPAAVRRLVEDASPTIRLAGALAANALPKAERDPLLQPLADDPVEAVADYAAALLRAPAAPEPEVDGGQ
jgi:tetratricopeptide (TPR) repeat protein